MATSARILVDFLSLLILAVISVISINPVILVPGDGGSQISAKLNKSLSPFVYCETKTNYYYTLWLDLTQITIAQCCFVDNMRLIYDPKTRKTFDSPGVNVKVPGFGKTETIEFLDPWREKFTSYYYFIVERLVKLGLSRNISIRGAPYDFRRSPNEFQEYFKNFKELVEETYNMNNNSKITLITHSMGSPTMLYFLNNQKQAWKDKYIGKMITISGVWGGAVKPLRLMISGDNLGIVLLKENVIRTYQRSASSTAWLMPYDSFWKSDEILVSRPGRNYTVKDYKQLFEDLNYTAGYEMRKDTENLVKNLHPPGVEIHCIYGVNIPTPATYQYDEGFPNSAPKIIYGPGDGTVNKDSLEGCLRWSKQQKQSVHNYTVENQDHLKILQSQKLIDLIQEIVTKK
ncbi:phospholipase A2 group XV [Octopus bimaculoides]|uniref:phospholipase A2 group XV n=1 Tax=Octopus bimaculoides TaxID=37653 RepID=UPI0022E7F212|nr:phospholipase A2 group XV [Octopus bimaculoides]